MFSSHMLAQIMISNKTVSAFVAFKLKNDVMSTFQVPIQIRFVLCRIVTVLTVKTRWWPTISFGISLLFMFFYALNFHF